MARLLTTNAAATTLASGLGGTTEDTTISLVAGTGTRFPALPYTGDYFSGVLINTAGQQEIVKVTARSTDTLTVVRAQEGTTIRSFSAGDRFEHRLTAGDIGFMQGSYWSREAAAVARVDNTHFTVVGDKTDIYVTNRAVRAIQTSTAGGFVVSSSYSSGTGLTTVVVTGMVIDSGLAAVECGQDPSSAPVYPNFIPVIPSAAGEGTVDAITATFSPALTLTDLTTCCVTATGANLTTTPTFAPNSLTAHTITRLGGQALRPGDISGAGHVLLLQYNLANTRWELLNPAVILESWAVAGGTVDAITLTAVPAVAALFDGLTVHFRAYGANTSTTPTLNVNGLGAKTLVKEGGQALAAGDIPAALAECICVYNLANTRWELLNPASTPTTSSTGSALSVMYALLYCRSASRASGPIPNGYLFPLITDELVTKTNATFDGTGKYYGNAGGAVTVAASESSSTGTFTWYTDVDDLWDGDTVQCFYTASSGATLVLDFGAGVTKALNKWTMTHYSGGSHIPHSTTWTGAGAHRYWRLRFTAAMNNGSGTVAWIVEYSDNGTSWTAASSAVSYTENSQVISMAVEAQGGDMTLIPAAVTTSAHPANVTLRFIHKAVDATTYNTDLKARVSTDGGSNWSDYGTITKLCAYDADYDLLEATFDTSSLTGTSLKPEITTHNTKSQWLAGIALVYAA